MSHNNLRAHTCAYRKGGLARALHPTSGGGIAQNPCWVPLTGKDAKSSFITSHPKPSLTPERAGLCHMWKELIVPAHLSTGVHTAGVTPASPPTAPPESGVWAGSLRSRREGQTPAQLFGEQKTRHRHSGSQHCSPGKVSVCERHLDHNTDTS